MSEEVVIDFRATADFGQITAEARQVQAAVESMRRSILATESKGGAAFQVAGQAWKSALETGGQFVTQNLALASSADKFADSLNRGKLTYRQANAAMKEYTTSTAKAHTELGRLIVQQELLQKRSSFLPTGRNPAGQLTGVMSTPTGMTQKELDKFFSSSKAGLNQMARLEEVANQKLIDMGKNAQWSGRQIMVGFTLPITLFATAAGKAFYTLDQQLTNIVKVYGDLNSQMSGDQIKELRSQIVGLASDLAKAWGTSSDVTLGVAQQMAAVGKQGNDLIQSTREAVRLSTLGGVDSEQSMKTILSMQSAFKISTQDLAESINFLNAVENQTSATLEDFTQALPIAGPAVHALGGDIKELALMLVAMREGGISANQAANALKTSLGRLINPTKAAKDLVKSFGIDLQGIVEKTQGDPVQTVEALAKAMEPLTRLQKDQVMAKIFGLQQYSRMTALFDNINKKSTDGLDAQTEKVKELIAASGAELKQVADQEIGRIADSASGQFNRAWESAKLALAGVGDQFLSIATNALHVLTPIIEWFNRLPDTLKTFGTYGLVGVALIGPVKMMMGLFANLVGTMRTWRTSAKNLIMGRKPDQAYQSAEEAARNLAKEANILDNQMYDSTEATKVWTFAMKELNDSLQKTMETLGLMKNVSLSPPAILTSGGRRQMATTLMARDSGHTILPDAVEKVMFGGRLLGPTRTIPQEAGQNAKQHDTFGSFFGAPGMAAVDPKTFAVASAQSAAFERMIPFGTSINKNFLTDVDRMVALSRRDDQTEFNSRISGFYSKYRAFFDLLEQNTERSAALIEAEINKFKTMSNAEVEQSLRTSLQQLNISWSQFQSAIAGKEVDVRSLAAQLAVHNGLGGGKVTQRGGSAVDNPFSRSGHLLSAMNAYGLPVTSATLDQGVNVAGQVTAAAETFSTIVVSASRQVAEQELAAARARWAAETNVSKQATLFLQMKAKEEALIRIKAAEEAAAIEVKGAQAERDIELAGAKAEAASGSGGLLGGRRGRIAGGGALLGLSMAATMLPQTGNASIDNATGVLSGVGTGAGIGMMAGPYGAAVGAVVGGLVSALPKLNDYLGRTEAASKAAFSTGETAANAFGAKIQSITDIQMSDMVNKTEEMKSTYEKFLEGFNGAQDGTDDRKFIDALMGADQATLTNLIQGRIVSSFAAGLKPDQVRAEVLAALQASGNSSLGFMDMLSDAGMFDPTTATSKLTTKVANSINDIVAHAQANAPKMPGQSPWGTQSDVSKAFNDASGGQAEWNRQLDATLVKTKDYQAALKPLADNMTSFALSMKAVDFQKFLGAQNLGAVSGAGFAEYIKEIPGISTDVTSAMDALSQHGATTAQMLEAINLKSQGVIKTWAELQTMDPARLDIILAINNTQVAITNDIVGPLLAKARSALANIKKATLLDSKQVQKDSKARQDAWKAEQKGIQDRYNKEIAAIKKAEDARQKAFDAEQKRLDRLKQLRDFAISYREAIASGDMAGAAHIQNNMEIAQTGWKNQDAADAAKAASDAKIAALEAERDAKVDAVQKAMDADEKATQFTLDNIDKINAARTKAHQAEINAAQERVNKLVELQNVPWNDQNRAKVAAAAGLTGKQIGVQERAAMVKEIGASGGLIWDRVAGDLSKAPWDLIAKLVNDKINGDPKDVLEDIKLINAWNPNAVGKTGTTGKGPTGNKPLPFSTGGPVWGAGNGTSDSINARLSHGEFVVKASSVNKYGAAFLHAINEGRFASGGLVGSAGDSLAKKSIFAAVESMVSGLFNPGTDAGRTGMPSGGLAQVVGMGLGTTIAKWAEQFVGVPYSRTGNNPHDGWGCAPFVNYVYKHFGYGLPSATVSNSQFNGLRKGVSPKDLMAGDLVFFHYKNGVNVGNAVNHVGMALNSQSMIEAANPRAGTRISGIDWANYVGARRVIDPSGKAYKDGGLLMYAQGGEYMMPRSAVQTYGVDMMDAMRNRTYHTGGLVTAGGPVYGNGGSTTGINVHVYPGPGMDEECLAEKVVQKIQLAERRKGSGR